MDCFELMAEFRAATVRESLAQNWLREADDDKEGLQAYAARRDPRITET